jgi:sulfur-carrier protein
MTTVRIPPTLRAEVGGERQVSATGGTVREVIDNLVDTYPGLRGQLFEDGEVAPFVNVYLEGEDVRTLADGFDASVTDGAKIILLPAMAGGSPRDGE